MTDISGGYQSQPFVAEMYDHIGPYRTRPDLDFYLDMANKSEGPVLELGCGTGRVLLPLARQGIEIVGLDASQHMLAVCQEKLANEPGEVQDRVQLFQGDMRHFNLDETFSLVTAPFRAFQHLLDVEDQINCLTSIQQHLSPGGTFILDIFNPSLKRLTEDNLGEEFSEDPPFQMPDGRQVIRRHKITARDLYKQIIYVELVYYVTHPGGREEQLVHAFPMRYLFRYEAEHLLGRCGFKVQALYADYDRTPFGEHYPGELIFVTTPRER